MSFLQKIFRNVPSTEVLSRRIYYSKLYRKLISKKKVRRSSKNIENNNFENVKSHIRTLGIVKGDLLILHSAYGELERFKSSPISIINFLRELVGEEGTIVMPAFYKTDETKTIKLNSNVCTTGMLPAIFIRMKGVYRSSFPVNALAAQGPKANVMFREPPELDLAHGVGSAWHYCAENQAKILLLGPKASKSLTMVHVAEDVLDSNWPIKKWYEAVHFNINKQGSTLKKTVRVRREWWAKFMVSEYRSKWLEENGLLVETTIEGLNVAYVADSKSLVDTLKINMVNRSVSFFRPPSKYWKS